MKSKRTLLFRTAAILILVAIGAVMMVIGRGHTVYFDSRSVDYNGQTYDPPYKIVVLVDGEQAAKLYDKDRGMATCIGQTMHLSLEITQEKGGEEELMDITLSLPYSMDNPLINLPAYLAGLPEEVYLSEFIPVVTEEPEGSEELPTDEFILGDI